MKANENGIGLECAKLLKDCGLESRCIFWNMVSPDKWIFGDKNPPITRALVPILPAFTWQEILWKYYKEFGLEHPKDMDILVCLQSGDYEEAEKTFIESCVLINKK